MQPARIDASVPRDAPASTRLFFTLALGFTLSLQLPATLAKLGALPGGVDAYLLPAALGGFGPLIAALIAARREGGRAAMRALWRASGRVGPGWYVVALLMCGAMWVAGAAVYRLFGGTGVQWLYLPENGQQVAAMLVVPLAEEPGWRGFALPRLQRRMGRLGASLVLGVLWAAWHTLMFVLQDATPALYVVAMVNVIAGSFVFTWLYNRSNGSLLVAILAHVGAHLNTPMHAPPGDVRPMAVYTAAVCVTACALVLFDRRAWRS